MSRASVANVAARAGAWRDFALRLKAPVSRSRDARTGSAFAAASSQDAKSGSWDADTSFEARTSFEANLASGTAPFSSLVQWFRARRSSPIQADALLLRAVPAALIVFLAIFGLIAHQACSHEKEQALGEAAANLEIVASAISGDMDRRLTPDLSVADAAFAPLLPTLTRRQGLQLIVANNAGKVVAAYPHGSATGSLSDAFGASELLTVFAEKAGVMRLMLPNGAEALATVRSLPASGGQLAVVQPLDSILIGWREGRDRMIVLVGSVSLVLAALAFGYAWQAGRARNAEADRRAMRERVDMVLRRGRCGLWDWNLASGQIDWSRSMFEIIGLAPREKAMTFAEVNALIHPGDGGLAELSRLVNANTTGSIDHVFRLRGASGEWVWMRGKAEIVEGGGGSPHLVGIAIDITETMALEERSAAADLRLRDAIETISEAFVVWDAENRLVMCNSKFQRFHNLPSDAVLAGTPYSQVMERGTAPLVQAQIDLDERLGERQPMGARTFEAQLGDGRWLQINERRTKDGGYVSVGTDITALKIHGEQLMDSERQLLSTVADLKKSRQLLTSQTQELAVLAEKYREQKAEAEKASRAKSDFLANMSHELRTPLNAILGFSEVMMTEAFGAIGSPAYLDYSKHIHQSGHYLNGVITDVLEMAHLESGRIRLQRSEFAVGEAVEAAVRSVARAAEAGGISVEIEPMPAATILADLNALIKILAILLNNGVKYTPAGGTVNVRAQVAQGALNLYVEDSGVGIPAAALSRLGNPFEQAELRLKDGMRGSGVGLAIARSLAELHGGTMRIFSKVDVGTTVLVQLPGETLIQSPSPQTIMNVRATSRPSRFTLPSNAEKRAASVG